MKRRLITLTILVLALFMIIGCGGGSDFKGTWVNVDNQDDWAKISESGNSYIWEDEEGKYPAKFEDGLLTISTGFGEAFASIDESGNMELTFMGDKDEYMKQ